MDRPHPRPVEFAGGVRGVRLVLDDDKGRIEEALRILYEYGDDFVAKRARALIVQVLVNMAALEKPAPTGLTSLGAVVVQSAGDPTRNDPLLSGNDQMPSLHVDEGEALASLLTLQDLRTLAGVDQDNRHVRGWVQTEHDIHGKRD